MYLTVAHLSRGIAVVIAHTASERRGNTFKGFEDFDPKAKAGIWP